MILGKPPTTKFEDGRIRSIAHDDAGVEPTLSLLDTLNIHTLDGYDVRSQVVALVKEHLKPGMLYKVRDEVGDGAFRRLATTGRAGSSLSGCQRLTASDEMRIGCLRRSGSDLSRWSGLSNVFARSILKKEAPNPILMGRHLIELGMKPGPEFKRILDLVYEKQLDGEVTSVEEAVEIVKRGS